ncbi:MAG: hypothetical protein K8E24_004165 [Methanobacterium paludis]|nr:hypothetical protein [Methanobacterium paludis]
MENKPLFRVKYGKEIIVNSNVNIEEMFLRSLLLGQGMGVLLYQRGYLVLHGSAVNINGNAVGFVGWQGEGKSTAVAALNAKGYPLVTDDILTIDFDERNKPIISPGFPRIKLWNDVINIMTDNTHLFPKILPEVQKYSYTADTHFKTESLPLKIIYILEKSEKNEINYLNFQNSLINLLKQSYNINLFDTNEKSQNFFQCVNLVKNVPVKRLKRCQSLKTLIDLAHIIEEDVFNLK